MKKTIYLLFALCALSMVSCNHSVSNKGTEAKMAENLMAKENKELVQKKEYKTQNGTVYLSGELQDTRTLEEQLNDIPRKEDIINTVIYKGNHQPDAKAPFVPEFEIKKVIKYKTHDIHFIIMVRIATLKTITLPAQQKVQLQLSPDHSITFNCKTSYQDIPNKNLDFLHRILCSTDISIEKVNELRQLKSDFSVIMKNTDNTFVFSVPKNFIEALKSI